MWKFKPLYTVITLTPLLFILMGCQNPYTSSYYSGSEVGQMNSVQNGVIVARTPIQIHRSSDGIFNVGSVTGAVVGGLLGSTIGQGNGRVLATGIGALAGGYAGNMAQDAVGEVKGFAYQIKLTNGSVISISQAAEPPLFVGQKVGIIQSNNGRSRVIAAN